MLIRNINLTGHRKSTCCLQLLVFLEIRVIAPFWHWRSQVFPKGCWPHDLKAFCKIGYKSVLLHFRKYELKMTHIIFKFIIYPSCERALRNGRVKPKIVRKSSLGDMIFWLHMIIYDYFSSVFCIVPKKVLLLKYQSELVTWKIVTIMQRWWKMQKQIFQSVLIAPCCFLEKKTSNFWNVSLSAVRCNGPFGCIMYVWGYQHWNTAKTTLDIYLLFENDHKSAKKGVKFVQP